MQYGIEQYSNSYFFEKIEKLLHENRNFSSEDERKLYYQVRFEQFKENLLDRFDLIVKQAKFFLIEENYTERIWKELYALHYANTNYSYGNKVIRIHFWNSDLIEENRIDEINDKNITKGYLGYVTLRPIPDYHLMLSSILPNWLVLKFETNAWVMTYDRHVHVFSFDIIIKTTVFYFQDTVFTSCAHADMLMFSSFLHNSYNFPRLSIADMIENNRYYPIPNQGLEYSDMLDVFYKNKIPVNFYHKPKKSKDRDVRAECIAVLNSYLESRLPIIVYNNNHVVLVIGHTDEFEKRFVVYDDSGYFLANKTKSKNFVGIVKAEDLFPDTGETYMIAATFERVYLSPSEYFRFLNYYLSGFESQEDDEFPKNYQQCRNIIVDNAVLKNYLGKNCIELDNPDVDKRMEILLRTDQPHYLWYSEYNCYEYRYILVADPTYPSKTRENIFPYGEFYCTSDNDGISLLTKIRGCN